MNEKIRTYLFNFSALLILSGAVLFINQLWIAPYLFAVGAAGMALCQLTLKVKDMPVRQRRLQQFNVLASLLMIVASGLMFNNRNEWVICLTIAAIFMTYTAFASKPQNKE